MEHLIDREKVIKALECRKNAGKRCGNPCEESGMCHYAIAVRGLDGEIYRPFVCDRERICADALALLKEQEDRHRLEVHNIGNVDIPEGVSEEHFHLVMNNVVEALQHTDKGESYPYEDTGR